MPPPLRAERHGWPALARRGEPLRRECPGLTGRSRTDTAADEAWVSPWRGGEPQIDDHGLGNRVSGFITPTTHGRPLEETDTNPGVRKGSHGERNSSHRFHLGIAFFLK